MHVCHLTVNLWLDSEPNGVVLVILIDLVLKCIRLFVLSKNNRSVDIGDYERIVCVPVW